MHYALRFHPNTAVWKPSSGLVLQEMSALERNWLLDKGSFTQKINALFQDQEMRVKLLQEGLVQVPEGSYEYDCLKHRLLYQRQVKLYLGENLLMYAKSCIAKNCSKPLKQAFRALGKKPLGHLLFTSHIYKRSNFEIAKINSNSKEYSLIAEDEDVTSPYLWGRRSIFIADESRLLLTEIFTPQLFQLIKGVE